MWFRKRKAKPISPINVPDDPTVMPSTTLDNPYNVEVITLRTIWDFDPRRLAHEYKIPRNCQSCGAPVDYSDYKCPFCGVPYVGGDRS